MPSHPWYKLSIWHRGLRPAQLAAQPLCELCGNYGFVKEATVVHHKVPHRGDWDLFNNSDNLQSLCKSCHDSAGQADDIRGYDKRVLADGWPDDPKHPFNRD